MNEIENRHERIIAFFMGFRVLIVQLQGTNYLNSTNNFQINSLDKNLPVFHLYKPGMVDGNGLWKDL